jgi:hypothetical protein
MNIKQKIAIKASLLMLLFIMVFGFSFSQSAKFEHKLDKGKTYIYSVAFESKNTRTTMGSEQVTTSKMSFLINMEAVDVLPDGKILLNMYYDSLKLESDNPQLPDISGELAKVNGKRVKGIMSKNGKISDITTIDKYSVSDLAKSIISRINIEKFNNIFQSFPDKELKVNDSWTETRTDTSDGNGAHILTKSEIEIRYTGKSSYEGKDSYKFIASAKETINGSGNQNGSDFTISGTNKSNTDSYFSDAKGILLGLSMNSFTDMTVDVSAAGMTIPMTTEVTLTMKLIK